MYLYLSVCVSVCVYVCVVRVTACLVCLSAKCPLMVNTGMVSLEKLLCIDVNCNHMRFGLSVSRFLSLCISSLSPFLDLSFPLSFSFSFFFSPSLFGFSFLSPFISMCLDLSPERIPRRLLLFIYALVQPCLHIFICFVCVRMYVCLWVYVTVYVRVTVATHPRLPPVVAGGGFASLPQPKVAHQHGGHLTPMLLSTLCAVDCLLN